jgi:hypothetical protein
MKENLEHNDKQKKCKQQNKMTQMIFGEKLQQNNDNEKKMGETLSTNGNGMT